MTGTSKYFILSTGNKLISPNRSGFRLSDSCVNQLPAITHEIYNLLDNRLKVRGVFFDILKTFDKVWHEGLLLKLSLNAGVILETEGNVQKIQKRTLFHYKKVKKSTPNLSSPDVYILFTIVLIKQVFEKIKSLRIACGSQTQS